MHVMLGFQNIPLYNARIVLEDGELSSSTVISMGRNMNYMSGTGLKYLFFGTCMVQGSGGVRK
jgi:hypothetical protein